MQSTSFTSIALATITLASLAGTASAARSFAPMDKDLDEASAFAQPLDREPGLPTVTTGVSLSLALSDDRIEGPFDKYLLTEAQKEAPILAQGPPRTLADFIANHPGLVGFELGGHPFDIGAGFTDAPVFTGGAGIDATGGDDSAVSAVPTPGVATVLTLGALMANRRRRAV